MRGEGAPLRSLLGKKLRRGNRLRLDNDNRPGIGNWAGFCSWPGIGHRPGLGDWSWIGRMAGIGNGGLGRAAVALLLLTAAAQADEMPSARAGKYEVSLRLPVDGLAAQEEMQIEYRVVDATQVDAVMGAAPVIRASARSVIDMPSMPGMAKMTESAHPEGVPGEYGVHPTFPHGGEYRLQLLITPSGGSEFAVSFPLQVGDAVTAKNRKAKPRPFYAEVRTPPKIPKAGEMAEMELAVFSRAGGNAQVREFVIQHEKPMHLIVVREDLGVFSHEHPEMAADVW